MQEHCSLVSIVDYESIVLVTTSDVGLSLVSMRTSVLVLDAIV